MDCRLKSFALLLIVLSSTLNGCGTDSAGTLDTPERHFAIVDQAREQTLQAHKSGGAIENLIEPEPSLAWLASNGHIQYRDLVLPNVDRRQGTLHWTAWGEKFLSMPDPEVLWMVSYMHHADLPISGEQPLHFQIWYRNDAEDTVIELIKELEALPKEASE